MECKELGCTSTKITARGYCYTCYKKRWKLGQFSKYHSILAESLCIESGCHLEALTRNRCKNHYNLWLYHAKNKLFTLCPDKFTACDKHPSRRAMYRKHGNQCTSCYTVTNRRIRLDANM